MNGSVDDLPPIAPEVVATILAGLAPRVRRRMDALIAEASSWSIERTTAEVQITFGDEQVVIRLDSAAHAAQASSVSCSCLLAPNCAHLGAVTAVAPVTLDGPEETTLKGESSVEAAAPDLSRGGGAPPAVDSDRTQLTPAERVLIAEARAAIAEILARGAVNTGVLEYAALLRALHRLRVGAFHTASAHYSTMVEQCRRARTGASDYSRERLTVALGSTLSALRALEYHDASGTVTDDIRGQARRSYRPVGNLTLGALLCEPVITESGYSGIAITYSDSTGSLWSVANVTPGDPSQTYEAYLNAVGFHQLAASAKELSRKKLLLIGATASADGRLGAGKNVQALAGDLLAPSTAWESLPVFTADTGAEGIYRFSGTVFGGNGAQLSVNIGAKSTATIGLSLAAATLDAGRDLRLLASAKGLQVTGLVRRILGAEFPVLVALAASSEAETALDAETSADSTKDHTALRLVFPSELAGRYYPGLDRLQRSYFVGDLRAGNEKDPAVESEFIDPTQWSNASAAQNLELASGVVDIRLSRWLGRLVAEGREAVLTGAAALDRDQALLRRTGALVAAQLLAELLEATRSGQRRFDGTWNYDNEVLLTAALKLAVYLEKTVSKTG